MSLRNRLQRLWHQRFGHGPGLCRTASRYDGHQHWCYVCGLDYFIPVA